MEDYYFGTINYAVHDGNGYCAYFVADSDAIEFMDMMEDGKYTLNKVSMRATIETIPTIDDI